jgi:hypothetical protein
MGKKLKETGRGLILSDIPGIFLEVELMKKPRKPRSELTVCGLKCETRILEI